MEMLVSLENKSAHFIKDFSTSTFPVHLRYAAMYKHTCTHTHTHTILLKSFGAGGLHTSQHKTERQKGTSELNDF